MITIEKKHSESDASALPLIPQLFIGILAMVIPLLHFQQAIQNLLLFTITQVALLHIQFVHQFKLKIVIKQFVKKSSLAIVGIEEVLKEKHNLTIQ